MSAFVLFLSLIFNVGDIVVQCNEMSNMLVTSSEPKLYWIYKQCIKLEHDAISHFPLYATSFCLRP